MMECLEAQQIVSEALDSEWTDTGSLERAKDHCRGCLECAAYVRALVEVRSAPTPEPPADLADRIMTTVRLQAARADLPADVVPFPAGLPDRTPASDGAALWARLSDPRHRKAVVAWTTAAAMIFVAAGFGAVAGMRSIMAEPSTDGITVLESTYDAGYDDQKDQSAAGTAATSPTADAVPGVPQAVGSVSTGFIVVDGVVYRSTGVDSSVTRGSLTQQGSARTALDTGRSATSRTLFGAGEPSRLFIQLEDQSMLGFDRVTTTFQGRTYVLRSGPITAFGERVTLPSGITEPSSSDGSPTFKLFDEEIQPPVYVRTAGSATEGIALPPNTQPDLGDAWTWWTPATE
ncbi:MAG: hypothetical protein U1E26_04330 [Coriobacteriia bacterium]|nr:hypothetical protein [Coriobacteriia bacterium]